MKFGERVTNYFHLVGIRSSLHKSRNNMDDALAQLENLDKQLAEDYTGQANPLLADILSKLHEHVALVSSCYENLEYFANYTGRVMRGWDEETAKSHFAK